MQMTSLYSAMELQEQCHMLTIRRRNNTDVSQQGKVGDQKPPSVLELALKFVMTLAFPILLADT